MGQHHNKDSDGLVLKTSKYNKLNKNRSAELIDLKITCSVVTPTVHVFYCNICG